MKYKEQLLNDILPFWLNNSIDYENGGIFTQLDRSGKIFGREKSVWFQGRSLWTFSKAYNIIEKNEQYLKAAENIYKFLQKCTDKDGRMFFSVLEDGKELQKRRYYYSETFAAIGCAEYFVASGKKQVLKDAEKYFDVAYECYKGIRVCPPKFNTENLKMKALAPTMIMLSTAQVLRSADSSNEKYNLVANECLNEILHGGYLKEFGLLENVTVSGEFANTPSGRIINPGHSMEAAWFVILEGILTQNKEAIEFGKKIVDVTWPLGWDEKNGGIIAFCDALGFPPQQLEWDMKLWWPQCETMIVTRLLGIIYNSEEYMDKYNLVKNYCSDNFVDKQCGEWYGYLHYDNSVANTLKGNLFKGPFHIPRMYMIMATLDKSGKIEDYM